MQLLDNEISNLYSVNGQEQEHERIRPSPPQIPDGLLCVVNLNGDDLNLLSARCGSYAVADEMIHENLSGSIATVKGGFEFFNC